MRQDGNYLSGVSVLFAVLSVEIVFWVWRIQEAPEFRMQVSVLAGLTLLSYGFCLWMKSDRKPMIAGYLFCLFFSAVLAALLWNLETFFIALLVSLVILGCRILPSFWPIPFLSGWLFFVLALSRYQTPWDTLPAESLPWKIRMSFYLILLTWMGFGKLVRSRKKEEKSRSLIASLNATIDELSSANMSYNSFVQLVESEAAIMERNRITREIHDGVGYALTNLIMLAESIRDITQKEQKEVTDKAIMIRNQAKLALNDTRRALSELRSAENEFAFGQKAIVHMVDIFSQATGVETQVEFLTNPKVLDDGRIFPVLYRFIQESLTNSFRHGQATKITIRMWILRKILITTIADNGSAPEMIQEGIGLQGMRERLGEIGGELSYQTLKGFSITARIPTTKEFTA